MAHLIDKSALVAEITHKIKVLETFIKNFDGISDKVEKAKNKIETLGEVLLFIHTLEVKEINSIVNPYDVCIQYTDRESAIKAHAEDYSWNIESELFQQLTPEQQKLWRKEIEQAVISGGYSGLSLAKDRRYDTIEVKEVDLEKEIREYLSTYWPKEKELHPFLGHIAKHFFELGLKAQKGDE